MQQVSDELTRTVELRDYLEILWRRKWIVGLALAVVLTAGVYRSLSEPKIYQAVGQILLTGDGSDESDFQTQIRILQGQAIKDKVSAVLPDAGEVAGTRIGESRIVNVAVRSRQPKRAADAVAAYVAAFIDYRQEQRVQQLVTVTEKTRKQIDDLSVEIDRLTTDYEAKTAVINEHSLPFNGESEASKAARALEVAAERRDLELKVGSVRDSLVSERLLLQAQLRDVNAENGLSTPAAEIVTPAAVPSGPISPKPVSDAVSAAAVGLILGIALAFLFEYVDESIKTKEDVHRAVGTKIPVVATIPLIVEWRDRTKPEVVSITSPRSSAAEAYRSLRTSVQFAGLEEPINVLAITSPTAGEGKSTALANLAVAVAAAGRRVVILDCDLRRPRIHSFFGLSNEIGFTSWIIGRAPLLGAVQEVPGIRRLSLMASGPIPPNPSELLSSRRFPEVVKALQADGALVLIDTPPLLPVTDAAVIARSIDAVFMVTMAGKGTRRHLRQALEILQRVDAPVSGIILNGVDADHFSYGYQASYYGEPYTGPAARPPADGPVPRPVQSGFPETRPADTRPVESRPADTRPADTRPADARPGGSGARPAGAQGRTGENGPAVIRPSGSRQGPNGPAGTSPTAGRPTASRPPVTGFPEAGLPESRSQARPAENGPAPANGAKPPRPSRASPPGDSGGPGKAPDPR